MRVNSLQKSNRVLKWGAASSMYMLGRSPSREHAVTGIYERPSHNKGSKVQATISTGNLVFS